MKSVVGYCLVALLEWTLTATLASNTLAASEQYCPATVLVEQKIQQFPAGWRALNNKLPNRLSAITFYDGPPEQNASLVNDASNKLNMEDTWHFQPGSEGIWIACSYAFTEVVLARQLPRGTAQCSVTYDPKVSIAGHPETRQVQCKEGKTPTKPSTINGSK